VTHHSGGGGGGPPPRPPPRESVRQVQSIAIVWGCSTGHVWACRYAGLATDMNKTLIQPKTGVAYQVGLDLSHTVVVLA
jgi:hypothetical protein